MSKRNSPDDPEPPEEPKRAEIDDGESDVERPLVPRRPFVLFDAPRMSCEGPGEASLAEASLARQALRKANRARLVRAEKAAAYVVDVDAPNTGDFPVDPTAEVRVVAVQQTELRQVPPRPREVICAESFEPAPTVAYRAPEGKDSEDSDSEVELPPHGSEGAYLSRAYLSRDGPALSPAYAPFSPAYEPSDAYEPSNAYAPSPEDSDEDFVPDEDGNSGVLGPDDE
jgi:hypothetical protein